MSTSSTQCSSQEVLTIQRWLANAMRTGRRDFRLGQRPHPRYTWNVGVTVEVVQDGQRGRSVRGTTVDISAGGLALRCRNRLEEDTVVKVTVGMLGGSVHAVVRRCAATMGESHLGVEFLVHERSCASLRTSA